MNSKRSLSRWSQAAKRNGWRWGRRRARLREGKKQVWLAVLRPINEGVHPRTVAALINTKLNKNGLARATIGSITVSINPDGEWAVDRR